MLTALHTAACAQPDAVRFSHLRSKETEIDIYTFDWPTEAACPPPPTPPCDQDCNCDGVDLSELMHQSFEASGLSYVDADGQPCEPPAGEVALQDQDMRSIRSPPGPGWTAAANEGVCEGNYTTLSDSWRGVSDPGGNHNDAALVEGWYRFEGAAGDAIALYDPGAAGTGRCGTQQPGWLSGCSPWTDGPDSWSCHENGSYPLLGELQNVTVCFSEQSYPCRTAVQIDVINCRDEFLVWHLRSPPGEGNKAFCTVSSGLPGTNPEPEPEPEPQPVPEPEPEPGPQVAGYKCVEILGETNCEPVHAPDKPVYATQSQCEASCAAPPRLAGNRYCCGSTLGSSIGCSGSNVSSLLVQFDQQPDGSTGSASISVVTDAGRSISCDNEAIHLDGAFPRDGQIKFPNNATAGDCLKNIDVSAGGGRIPNVNYMTGSNSLSWAYGAGAPMVLQAGDCKAQPPPPPTVCRKRPDGWVYKVSVCSPLHQSELPANCVDVESWNAGVAQFPLVNSTYKRSGCQPVGMAITEATRNAHGVVLKWEDSQHGTTGEKTTVTGSLICDEDGVGHIESMSSENFRGEVEQFSFDWHTEAACHPWAPPPPPPSYTPDLCVVSADTCMCDGTDVSNIKGTATLVDADKSTAWVYKLGICGPVSRAGLPKSCLDTMPANATALRYERQAKPGEEPRCEQLGGGSVKATHTEDAHGKRDGVDIIYSFESTECVGVCEVNLRVQCSAADAAVRYFDTLDATALSDIFPVD